MKIQGMSEYEGKHRAEDKEVRSEDKPQKTS